MLPGPADYICDTYRDVQDAINEQPPGAVIKLYGFRASWVNGMRWYLKQGQNIVDCSDTIYTYEPFGPMIPKEKVEEYKRQQQDDWDRLTSDDLRRIDDLIDQEKEAKTEEQLEIALEAEEAQAWP